MAKSINATIKDITQNWYIKVLHCKAENKGFATATYGYFTNSESAKQKENAVELQNISFTVVSDKDVFAQAYEALSKIDEFTDALDC